MRFVRQKQHPVTHIVGLRRDSTMITQRTMKLDAVTLENREITIIIVTSVGADQGKGSQSSENYARNLLRRARESTA